MYVPAGLENVYSYYGFMRNTRYRRCRVNCVKNRKRNTKIGQCPYIYNNHGIDRVLTLITANSRSFYYYLTAIYLLYRVRRF